MYMTRLPTVRPLVAREFLGGRPEHAPGDALHPRVAAAGVRPHLGGELTREAQAVRGDRVGHRLAARDLPDEVPEVVALQRPIGPADGRVAVLDPMERLST
jgi:hypothetical protein